MINYYLLMKPGILLGNLVTFTAGYLLASRGHMNPTLFLATLFGLAFVMASGCVFNNYIDVPLDGKMARTKERPLVKGLISGKNALIFGSFLGLLGMGILLTFTPFITAAIAGFGFIVYVLLYSLWKSHTVYGTAIGSIAGAIPPVVGYTAVSGQLDLGALLLFALMTLWQMPHFFAIALYRLDDYAKAGIPVLPLEKGLLRTKVHMTLYIAAFILVSLLLTYFNYTGYIYLVVTLVTGLAWLSLALKGFLISNNQIWGRQMFVVSLFVILTLSLVIPIDLYISF